MIVDITLFKSDKIPIKQRKIFIKILYIKGGFEIAKKSQGLNGREIVKKLRKENESSNTN